MTISTWSTDATIDSTIDGENKDNNTGSNPEITIGLIFIAGAKAARLRGILNFDLSSFPGDVDKILHAKMTVYVQQHTNTGDQLRIERCTRPADWLEAEVTWKNYRAADLWTTQGGDKTAVDSAKVTAPTALGSWDFPGLGLLCIDAIKNRSNILSVIHKLASEPDEGDDRYFEYPSTEGATVPSVTITYGDRLVERSYPRGAGRGVGRGVT